MAKIITNLFGELALLPIPARVPLRETLEWRTDLMTSFNGTENRLRLRNHPRQTFLYNLPETASVKPSAFIAQYGALGLKWAVPLWAEAQHLGTVLMNLQTILCDTTNYDLRAQSLALLYQNATQWQVVEIDTVATGELTLVGYTDAFQNAYLIPLRLGHIEGSPERTSNGYEAETQLRFEIEDIQALAEDAPAQFLGRDLYLTPGLFTNDALSHEISTRVDRVDYALGKVARRTPWRYNRDTRPKNVLCEGAAEVRAYRKWLMRRAGRFRPFWEPTFENDLRHKASGTVTNVLPVQAADGLLDWLPLRNHIAVLTSGGTWLCRTINSAALKTGDASTVELTLDSALNVAAGNIHAVSFLGLRRLDTDRVELNWRGNSVVASTVNTVEIQP